MQSIYLTGLKKHTGKTTIAASLLATMQSLSYSTGYFKTIQSGVLSVKAATDEIFIKNMDSNIITSTGYAFDNRDCPLIGAYEAGIGKISIQKIVEDCRSVLAETEFSIIEGANSISSPIDDKNTDVIIAKEMKASVVLVVNSKKDSMDEVISGVNYIKSNGLNLDGIIVNDFDIQSEKTTEKYFPHLVKEFTDAKIIGCFPSLKDYEFAGADTLIAETLSHFNVSDIFGLDIVKLKI